ncbi:MAG: cobalamin biosynthesis protein CbiX [Micromonosporaceae bacterium]|nr:cobalamin biosynthesis protein CbiX [Micromonosporaceae bacterium]
MRALAARVGQAWPAPVVAAFLDFDEPSIPDTLADFPDGTVPVVVPALLTNAYHGRVDLPGVLARVPRPTVLADVLGPDPLLVAGMRRRLSELDDAFDAVVLVAAGTSDPAARSTVDDMADELGRQLDVPCLAGYASASAPTPGEAVATLRAAGARRILGAAYFLATGRLYTTAVRSAVDAGAVDVAAPLGTADELVHLVLARAAAAIEGRNADSAGHRAGPALNVGGPATKKAPVPVPGRFS